MTDWPNMSRLSARHIRDACDDSLRRLQTDHIDLYQMHHVDRDTPWDEIWQAMDLLVAQGKVIYVGSSNFAGWHITAAVETARRRGSLGLVSEQSLYNLTARTVELEVLPACQAYGVGVIPWSPLEWRPAGRRADISAGRPARRRRPAARGSIRCDPQLEAWEKVCADLGEQPADVALAWLLVQPGRHGTDHRTAHDRAVHGQPAGARHPASTVGALEELDRIFPGPGGPAPRGVRLVGR